MTEMPSGDPATHANRRRRQEDRRRPAPRRAQCPARPRLEPHLSRDQLPQVGALDRSAPLDSARARPRARPACARPLARMAAVRAGPLRRAVALPHQITLTLSFVVFTFGSLLVAIQVAGGQLTPRIIATTLLRDNVVRYSVGLFVFTLVFAVMALDRLDKVVLRDRVAHHRLARHRLHGDVPLPHRLCGAPAAPGQHPRPRRRRRAAVITAVYPEPAAHAPEVEAVRGPRRAAARTVPHAGTSAIILAVDLDTLVARGAAHWWPHRAGAAGRRLRRDR